MIEIMSCSIGCELDVYTKCATKKKRRAYRRYLSNQFKSKRIQFEEPIDISAIADWIVLLILFKIEVKTLIRCQRVCKRLEFLSKQLDNCWHNKISRELYYMKNGMTACIPLCCRTRAGDKVWRWNLVDNITRNHLINSDLKEFLSVSYLVNFSCITIWKWIPGVQTFDGLKIRCTTLEVYDEAIKDKNIFLQKYKFKNLILHTSSAENFREFTECYSSLEKCAKLELIRSGPAEAFRALVEKELYYNTIKHLKFVEVHASDALLTLKDIVEEMRQADTARNKLRMIELQGYLDERTSRIIDSDRNIHLILRIKVSKLDIAAYGLTSRSQYVTILCVKNATKFWPTVIIRCHDNRGEVFLYFMENAMEYFEKSAIDTSAYFEKHMEKDCWQHTAKVFKMILRNHPQAKCK